MNKRNIIKTRIKEKFLWWWISFRKKKELSVLDSLESLCIILGPYRNLTTITAAILSLHPNCQVLNHAAKRVIPNKKLNFLVNYSDKKFAGFYQFAVFASQRGIQGDYGGSITYSHVFHQPTMRQTYFDRYPGQLLKKEIKSIVWKDSLRISNLIREKNIDLDRLFSKNKRIRFLLPVRNPLDCTISNCKTGHVKEFKGISSISVGAVLEEILKEFHWFLRLEHEYPHKFFHFFEDEFHEDMLIKLAGFLGLESEDRWIKDSLRCIDIKHSYEYNPEWVETCHRLCRVYFADHQEFLDHLEKLLVSTAISEC